MFGAEDAKTLHMDKKRSRGNERGQFRLYRW